MNIVRFLHLVLLAGRILFCFEKPTAQKDSLYICKQLAPDEVTAWLETHCCLFLFRLAPFLSFWPVESAAYFLINTSVSFRLAVFCLDGIFLSHSFHLVTIFQFIQIFVWFSVLFSPVFNSFSVFFFWPLLPHVVIGTTPGWFTVLS